MQNKHSSSGIAEDLIRSFVQIASAELHVKTILEKRISELENGMYEEDDLNLLLEEISTQKEQLIELAEIRRSQMLTLYEMYDSKGNKEQWCMVKHLGMAMYTAFECWQASNDDSELFSQYLRINKMFIKCITKFLGVEITDCSSCFSDILKAKENQNG